MAWLGFAALLLIRSARVQVPLERVVAVTFAIHGIVTLVASRGRHLAWPVFLAIAGLAWLGSG